MISLCMIVKDEEETLERCLESARPHVDEIVIVDTGSTDSTLDIARKYADILEEIEWPGDFSAARNISMDLATNDFILILDGDEYIEDEITWQQIKASPKIPGFLYGFLWVNNTIASGMVGAERVSQPRLFKNLPEIRYHQIIHNQIEDRCIQYTNEHEGCVIVQSMGFLVHTGYDLTLDQARSKYLRRIPMLIKAVKDARCMRDDAYYKHQLALTYHITHQFEEACETWMSMNFAGLNAFNAFYAHYIASNSFMRMNDTQQALYHANEMFRLNRGEPICQLVAGNLMYVHGLTILAVKLIIESYLENAKKQGDVRFVLDGLAVREHLARIYEINNPERAQLIREYSENDVYYLLRELQKELVPIDESMFEYEALAA